ncbi:MAG: hydroxymethylbilane synthase [Gemmatimonadales bacterium]
MTTRRRTIRIGTRRSDLARWQAEHVAAKLKKISGAPATEIVFIKTEGDRIIDIPLHAVDGKAFFTKEIEQALLNDAVDVAVHSLKDIATELPDGLSLGAVLERDDPRDVLLANSGAGIDELPSGARLGTSSLRRRALLARLRPDLDFVDLRGNVPTRIEKLRAGQYDAIVLAAAGVRRLGLEEHVTQYLPVDRILPAVSQGAIAIEVRDGDAETLNWINKLDHANTRIATSAERALLRKLEGGCQVPVGALGIVENDVVRLSALVCSLSGEQCVEGAREGPKCDATALGKALADDLLQRGGARILAEIRGTRAEVI